MHGVCDVRDGDVLRDDRGDAYGRVHVYVLLCVRDRVCVLRDDYACGPDDGNDDDLRDVHGDVLPCDHVYARARVYGDGPHDDYACDPRDVHDDVPRDGSACVRVRVCDDGPNDGHVYVRVRVYDDDPHGGHDDDLRDVHVYAHVHDDACVPPCGRVYGVRDDRVHGDDDGSRSPCEYDDGDVH